MPYKYTFNAPSLRIIFTLYETQNTVRGQSQTFAHLSTLRPTPTSPYHFHQILGGSVLTPGVKGLSETMLNYKVSTVVPSSSLPLGPVFLSTPVCTRACVKQVTWPETPTLKNFQHCSGFRKSGHRSRTVGGQVSVILSFKSGAPDARK